MTPGGLWASQRIRPSHEYEHEFFCEVEYGEVMCLTMLKVMTFWKEISPALNLRTRCL
jgi:hypothetical protein